MYLLRTKLSENSKTTRITTDESILAISWNIATEPKLYRKLAYNPYSPKALQLILKRFPSLSTPDVIKAVVLAEPEGRYDRNFNQLEAARQEEELLKQKNISAEINKRLAEFCEKYSSQLSTLPKEFVYDNFSLTVFETTDLEKIEQRYSQDQRRDLRLSIVNFLDDSQRFSTDKKPVLGGQALRAVFATLSLVLLFVSGYAMYLEQVERQTQKKQVLALASQKNTQRMPVRLKIPAISVDAVAEHVGLTSEGEMEVPQNTVDVGWFNLGPRPGEKGSAVVAGHVDGENGETGVFANLYKLKVGDKLYVEDTQGTTIAFVVRESRIYDPGFAHEVFSSSDSSHLNLITCDGVWDGAKKSYTKRLVVFTDIAPQP